MNRMITLLLALLLPAAFCLPAISLAADPGAAGASETAKPAAKKPAAKKKKKKKKPEPVNEYKFSAVEKVETYKFDRKADPIVKKPKTKKVPAKKAPAAPKDAPGQAVGTEASGAAPEIE